MKKHCNICKFCSDVINNVVVSCDADCRWKERPSYKKYMVELERSNALINPVTGDRNDRCPSRSNYGYVHVDDSVDVVPAQYVLCAVRNKRFDCRHYVRTDKVPYTGEVLCPHCNLKMVISSDRWHGNCFWGNENVAMKADGCDFICTVDDGGKIIGFYKYEANYDSISRSRSRELGAVVVEVKTRLGLKIGRSDYGWTDDGDYYKKVGKPKEVVSGKRRGFWRWLMSDDMVVVL